MMRMKFIEISALIVFAFGGAGAENVTLVGSYDTPGSAKGVYVSGNYAYVSCWRSGLVILDVSDPTLPVLEGQITIPPWQTWDAHLWGSYAFLANDITAGLAVVDVTDPTLPRLVGEYDTPGWAYCLVVDGTYAYIADGFTGYFQIIEITNPSNPTLAADFNTDGWARGICISGSLAYLANGSNFKIIDIANPRSPVLRGTLQTLWSTIAVSVLGDYAYVVRNQNDDSSLVLVTDVSNPDTIIAVSTYLLPVHAWDIFTQKQYAYIANSDGGLLVLDISNPDSLVRFGGYNTPGDARHVFVDNNLIYVADDSSLMIFRLDPMAADDVGPPGAIGLLSGYPNPFNATTTIEYALPQAGQVKLQIYDICGRAVATLAEGHVPAGHHSTIWDARGMPSGMYLVRLQTEGFTETTKVTLLR
jgi:hypothetical protein